MPIVVIEAIDGPMIVVHIILLRLFDGGMDGTLPLIRAALPCIHRRLIITHRHHQSSSRKGLAFGVLVWLRTKAATH
jgi:hypothetical protein